MRVVVLALICVSLCAPGASQKRKPKPPDIEVVEARARRDAGKILVDGRVRATGEKPIRGLVMVFDFITPENGVVGTEKAVLDEDIVEPGQERVCHAATREEPRAVKFRIRGFDTGDRELRVSNTGPFPIE